MKRVYGSLLAIVGSLAVAQSGGAQDALGIPVQISISAGQPSEDGYVQNLDVVLRAPNGQENPAGEASPLNSVWSDVQNVARSLGKAAPGLQSGFGLASLRVQASSWPADVPLFSPQAIPDNWKPIYELSRTFSGFLSSRAFEREDVDLPKTFVRFLVPLQDQDFNKLWMCVGLGEAQRSGRVALPRFVEGMMETLCTRAPLASSALEFSENDWGTEDGNPPEGLTAVGAFVRHPEEFLPLRAATNPVCNLLAVPSNNEKYERAAALVKAGWISPSREELNPGPIDLVKAEEQCHAYVLRNVLSRLDETMNTLNREAVLVGANRYLLGFTRPLAQAARSRWLDAEKAAQTLAERLVGTFTVAQGMTKSPFDPLNELNIRGFNRLAGQGGRGSVLLAELLKSPAASTPLRKELREAGDAAGRAYMGHLSGALTRKCPSASEQDLTYECIWEGLTSLTSEVEHALSVETSQGKELRYALLLP